MSRTWGLSSIVAPTAISAHGSAVTSPIGGPPRLPQQCTRIRRGHLAVVQPMSRPPPFERPDDPTRDVNSAAPDLCPMLHGQRVVLHPLCAEHAGVLFPILSDAELWRYAPRLRSNSLAELRDRCARLESRRSNDGREHWLNWAVEEKARGSIVGFVQTTVDKALCEATIAYVLARASWGRGLASDAVGAMLAHLKTIGVPTFLATVDSRNLRSIRLLESFVFRVSDAKDGHNVRYVLAATDLVCVREELPGDAPAISAVHRAAFGRDAEALVVERLREDGLIVASVVSEADGEIVGSAVFSALHIATERDTIGAVALAPAAVVPKRQRRGIGSRMIDAGLRLCRERGIHAVMVVGDPAYYSRFGFSADIISSLTSKYVGPHWMGLELVAGSLQGAAGTVEYSPAFEVVD